MKKILAAACFAMMAVGAPAQVVPAPAAPSVVEPAKGYDAALSGFEKEFMAAAQAMPADKYNFTPASLNIPGAKYDGVRTFAQEVTHVTQANYGIYAALLGAKPDVDVKAIGDLKTKDEIVAAAAASFVYAHKAIATLTLADENTGRGKSGTQSNVTIAAYGISHGFDHYGQMVEYLRMNGIVPDGSK